MLSGARRADAAVFYRVFNADGDEVEQCGNGARCIAALLHERGRTRNGAVTLESPAGVVQARLSGAGRVSVDMGVPNFAPRSLPFRCAEREADSYALEVAGRERRDRRGLDGQSARRAHAYPRWTPRRWRPWGPRSSATRAFRAG